jgi:hypothetical protein
VTLIRYEKWSEKSIPNFVQGETATLSALDMKEGHTTAPSLVSAECSCACA